ncbi:MAG: hypothetical protein Kow0077_05860 [Anaerolineae bacterium]
MPRDVGGLAGPVVVSGQPQWLETVARIAASDGLTVAAYEPDLTAEALRLRLVSDYAAMLIVDAEAVGWERRVLAVKSAAATRRIPVVVVADDLEALGRAVEAGADQALRPGQLEEMLPRVVRALARRVDETQHAALCAQCEQPLPSQAREAIRLFNQGEYYRQHDLFEALWMAEPGPIRNLYRAILQVGVGYYHIQRGNFRGALKMLLRAAQWLYPLPDVCQGVDVAGLKADASRVRLALEALLAGSTQGEIDPGLLKPVRLVGSGEQAE